MEPIFSDYKVLFKLQGKLSCLHSEMEVSQSLGLARPITLWHGGNWDSYLSREGEKRCNEAGREFLGNVENYRRFAHDFRAYIAEAHAVFIPSFETVLGRISPEKFEEIFSFLARFWHFYGFTEFPYSEGMQTRYEETNDLALAAAIEDFGELKFKGREILNAYIHEGGVMDKLLGAVAAQAGLDAEDRFFLYADDIRAFLRGAPANAKTLAKRRKYYGCGFDGQFHIFDDARCRALWKKFHPALAFDGTLKGTVAHKGMARGRVAIAPQLVSADAIHAVVKKMHKGDILVAESTTPEFLPLCRKAAAIVADQGGLLSHAAVVSREFGIPCIVGTERGTQVLRDGDLVEVDANEGVVKVLERAA